MTLADVNDHDPVSVTAVQGGHGLRRRLSCLGFAEGDTIRVLSHAAFRGPLLVEARGARIAVGRGVARKITVTPIGATSPGGRS